MLGAALGLEEAPRVITPPLAALDAGFGHKLDLWLSYCRVLIGGMGLALVLVLLPEQRWSLGLLVGYIAAAALVPSALRLAGTPERMGWVRILVLCIDVLVVAAFTYAWGIRTSPALFMFLPIVVGWTLTPQKGIGRLALVLVLAAIGVLLIGESYALWLPGFQRSPASITSSAPGGALLFLASWQARWAQCTSCSTSPWSACASTVTR